MAIDTATDAVVARRRQLRSVWDQTRVVAILAIDDDSGLSRVLAALAAQTRRPDLVIATIAASGEGVPVGGESEHVLVVRLAEHGITTVPVRPGAALRDQVAAALALDQLTAAPTCEPAVETELDGVADARGQWLWLLRGDTAPEPQALERLLAAVETAPSVAVAGCKQVRWDDDQRLLDVGITTSRLGAVITGLDRGELDQGQQDQRTDVLAVRTAGMLVRRDVWTGLGGPDRALTGARDDLEFCRRVRLRGHRVVVVPGAVVSAAASTGRTGFGDDRRDALTLRLAWARWWMVLPALLWSMGAALVRAVTQLVLKQPQQAVDELVVAADLILRPPRWLRARRRIRSGAIVPVRALHPLGATGRALVRQRRDEVAAWIRPSTRARRRAMVGPPAWPVLGPVLLLTLAAGLTAGRRLLTGEGAVVSPVLTPVPSRALDLWQAATASWRPTGLGSSHVGDPLGAVLALLSLPVGADPGRLVALLLLAGPMLAALVAWATAASLTSSRAVRAGVAAGWAVAPPLLAAVLTGRPGAVVAHLVLPPLALAVWRSLAHGSLTAASVAGLTLTLALAAAPVLTVPLVTLLVVLTALAMIRGGVRRLFLTTFTLLVPGVLLLPWWVEVARTPLLLLADPALGWSAAPATPWWHLAALPGAPEQVFGVGRPGAERLTGVLATGGVGPDRVAVLLDRGPAVLAGALIAVPATLALLALLRRRRAAWAAVGSWTAVVAGLAGALVAERAAVGASRSWPGPALSLLLLGLLVASLVVLPVLQSRLGRVRTWLRRGVLTVTLVVTAAPLLTALAAVAVRGVDVGVGRADPDVLPAVAAAEAAGPGAGRTLTLQVDGDHVRWTLYRRGGPRFGDDATARRLDEAGAADSRVVLPVVSALLAPAGRDQRGPLADLGVGTVALVAPVDETAEQALDAAPGLVRVSSPGSAGSALWRVDPAPDNQASSRAARVRVIDPDGVTRAVLPSRPGQAGVDAVVGPGPAGRRVVLAERADEGWGARLDGVALAAAAARVTDSAGSGWAQAFTLPADGGRLLITHTRPQAWLDSTGVVGARIGMAILAILVALPLPSVRRRIRAPLAPRPTHRVERDPDAVRDPLPAPQVFGADHPEDGELPPVFADEIDSAAAAAATGPEPAAPEPSGPIEPELVEVAMAEPAAVRDQT